MSGRVCLVAVGVSALLLCRLALAQTDIQQLGPGAETQPTQQIGAPVDSTARDVPQVIPARPADDGRIESITPGDGTGVQIDQPQGRDLCDPDVPQSVRDAAGVSCEGEILVNGRPVRRGLAQDPLLAPKREDLKSDFEKLDLGDDVPATVILQQ